MFFLLLPIDTGIRQSELIMWYLEEKENEIETEEDLVKEQIIIGKVISRLIKKVI